jgi:rhamnosyltransferase
MQNDLVGVVILYKPNYEEILRNISSYVKELHKLYIICNSKINDNLLDEINSLYKNIEFLKNDDINIGIAQALNEALNKAKNENYTYLLTMDQDTFFENNSLNLFLEDFRTLDKKDILIYSPIHNKKFISNRILEKEFVMTSANIINVAKALEIGGFDENLFIDEVDHEFCFRVQENKYKIVQNEKIAVNHSLGNKTKNNITLYSAFRLYYISRNFLYLQNKYYNKQSTFLKKRRKYLIKFFLRHLIYSNERLKCLKMILLGIIDYKSKKFGKSTYE